VFRLVKISLAIAATVTIATLLLKQTRSRIEPTGEATLGVAAAPVVLVYYTDYRCSSCRVFATETLPELRTRFVDTGVLRVVVKDLGLSVESVVIANAARCAGEFGKYWLFHDSILVATDAQASAGTLNRIAAHIGVPADPFSRCVNARRHVSKIQSETARARRAGIREGPAFAVGRRDRPLRLQVGVIRTATLSSWISGEVGR
jgi:protein-disulfide isomerase